MKVIADKELEISRLKEEIATIRHDFPVGWQETYRRMKEEIKQLRSKLKT